MFKFKSQTTDFSLNTQIFMGTGDDRINITHGYSLVYLTKFLTISDNFNSNTTSIITENSLFV